MKRLPGRRLVIAIFWSCVCCSRGLLGESGSIHAQEVDELIARGAAVWEQQCLRCHGEDGGGVAGKYEHRLSGPGSLEELAALIEQTMPEDDPELCAGEDARAVARFLLAGILAPERAEGQAATQTLQHLTGGQYLLAIAELGDAFFGPQKSVGERGLKGRYFDGREFKQEKQVAEQVDPQVDFDWQAKGPLGEKTGPEEFCVEWSGSVFVEESGEYEWLIRSPNGYRLYVNRQDEPLLDSWVATRDDPEKSARLRLVGGRWYPVRIQALKVKDPGFSIQWLWRRPRRLVEVVPESSLNAAMAKPTLLVQTAFPGDDYTLGFERGTLFTPEWEEATTQAAWEVGERVVAKLPAWAGARPDAEDFREKCRDFCVRFAEVAFRRPLEPEERERYVDALHAERSPSEGTRISLLAILKSPWFLYRLEQSMPFEQGMAERIAWAVTDGWAREAVRQRVADSGLRNPATQMAFAEQLLDSPAGRVKWRRFFIDWLNLEAAAEVSKDKDTFAQFDAALLDDLQESALRFVAEVWQSSNADFRRLLLANELWMSPRMREIYLPGSGTTLAGERDATDASGAGGFEKVELSREDRAGLLTHPLLLSQLAYFRSTSPIHRGVFVTRKILGLPLKPPPVAVEPLAEDFGGEMTTRERVELQTRPDNCMGCHQLINPFGFALERYDAIGRIRELERGRPVDSRVNVALPGRAEVEVNGARELAEYLANERETHRHFVRAVFQHAVQRPPESYSAGLLDELTDEFIGQGYNMRKLVVAIALRTATEVRNQPAAQSGGEE